jgi:serpin B
LATKLADIASKKQVQLRVANALWPHQAYPLLETFLDLTRRYYKARVTPVDYGHPETARRTINAWVEEKTEQKIKEIIPSGLLNDLTRLVLVNGIYFKADWARQFDPDRTRDKPFWVAPGAQVHVPMMSQVAELGYCESDDLQLLELPYAGDDLSMVVLLPREVDGLAALETRLTTQNLNRWTRAMEQREVSVTLPRFEIACPFRLGDTLQSMGMIDAFAEADFSGIDGTRMLYLAAVLHKAFVAVNEEGTEAAAATAVVMRTLSMPEPVPVFRADHPFILIIREKSSGSVLFFGRVANPAPGSATQSKDRNRRGLGQALAEALSSVSQVMGPDRRA